MSKVSASAIAEIRVDYQQVLGRDARPDELGQWMHALKHHGTLASVRDNLAHSAEARQDIERLYHDELGRDADPGGLAAQLDGLAHGATLNQLRANMAHSDEAAGDIDCFYHELLGRGAEPAGLAHWQGRLAAGETVGAVRSDIAHSPEAVAQVQAVYAQQLGRAADASEIDGFQAAKWSGAAPGGTFTVGSGTVGSGTAGSGTVGSGSGGGTLGSVDVRALMAELATFVALGGGTTPTLTGSDGQVTRFRNATELAAFALSMAERAGQATPALRKTYDLTVSWLAQVGQADIQAAKDHSKGQDAGAVIEQAVGAVLNVAAFIPVVDVVAAPAAAAWDAAQAGQSFSRGDVLGGVLNLGSAAGVGLSGVGALATEGSVSAQLGAIGQQVLEGTALLGGLSGVAQGAARGDPLGAVAGALEAGAAVAGGLVSTGAVGAAGAGATQAELAAAARAAAQDVAIVTGLASAGASAADAFHGDLEGGLLSSLGALVGEISREVGSPDPLPQPAAQQPTGPMPALPTETAPVVPITQQNLPSFDGYGTDGKPLPMPPVPSPQSSDGGGTDGGTNVAADSSDGPKGTQYAANTPPNTMTDAAGDGPAASSNGADRPSITVVGPAGSSSPSTTAPSTTALSATTEGNVVTVAADDAGGDLLSLAGKALRIGGRVLGKIGGAVTDLVLNSSPAGVPGMSGSVTTPSGPMNYSSGEVGLSLVQPGTGPLNIGSDGLYRSNDGQVVGMHLGFGAGSTLVTADGQTVGTTTFDGARLTGFSLDTAKLGGIQQTPGLLAVQGLTPISVANSGGISAAKVANDNLQIPLTDPANRQMAQSVIAYGDQAGTVTESIVNSVAKAQGLTALDGGKYGSNNGFDHVFQNLDGTVTILMDSKQFQGGATSLSTDGAGGQTQLTDAWVRAVLPNLDATSPAAKAVKTAVDAGSLVKGIIGIDRTTGNLIMIRVK